MCKHTRDVTYYVSKANIWKYWSLIQKINWKLWRSRLKITFIPASYSYIPRPDIWNVVDRIWCENPIKKFDTSLIQKNLHFLMTFQSPIKKNPDQIDIKFFWYAFVWKNWYQIEFKNSRNSRIFWSQFDIKILKSIWYQFLQTNAYQKNVKMYIEKNIKNKIPNYGL
jgi:hypothetical protein